MGRGRKSKPGKRYPSGKRKPDGVAYDRGTERAQATTATYGTHGGSPIGRAYAMGLLGVIGSDEAKDRLDAGKKLAANRVLAFGRKGYRCALDQSPRGADAEESEEAVERKVTARATLKVMECQMGPGGFRAWELVDPNYADCGPGWLDGLLAGRGDGASSRALQSALDALDAIAPVRRSRMVAA